MEKQRTWKWYQNRKCFEIGPYFVWAKSRKEAIGLLQKHLGIAWRKTI